MKSSMLKIAVMLVAITFILPSCKKEEKKDPTAAAYTCTSCKATPDALAENDASSKGVYKGIFIGSSGTIKFSVMNGGSDIVATMVIDGTTVTLNSSISWVNGDPYIAPFTGTLNGQPVSITFSVEPDGSNPTILSSNIPGHPNTVFTLIKETSNALIECFEGTYSTTKPESGTFNILLSRTLGRWGGIARETGTNDEGEVSGTIVNGALIDDENRTVGSLNGDVISGSFQDSNGSTVTIEGERTL